MRNHAQAMCWGVLAAGASVLPVLSDGAYAAPVRLMLDVTVRTGSGAPLAAAPIEASTPHDNQFALTDAAGRIHFTLEADDADRQIVVRLWHGEGFDLPIGEAIGAEERYEELASTYAFPMNSVVPLRAGQTAYTLEITAKDGVTVSGTLRDEAGVGLAGVIGVVNGRSHRFIAPDAGGRFSLGGVPKGEAVELLFGAAGNRVHLMPLTAAQTSADGDLGVITLAEPEADATVRLEMTNREGFFGYADAYLGGSLTLIGAEARVVQFFPVNSLNAAASPDLSSPLGGRAMVPAGTYYISPGTIGKALPLALLEAIRDGRRARLDAAGVPKITAVAGETVSLSFDARAAREAILSVAGDLMPRP